MTVLDRRTPLAAGLTMVEGRTAVLEVHGDLDVASSPLLREALGELATRGKSQIVVDLTGVDFVDSTGLETLLAGQRRAQSANGGLVLVCGDQARLRRLFRVAGVDDVLPAYETVDQARAAVAATPLPNEG